MSCYRCVLIVCIATCLSAQQAPPDAPSASQSEREIQTKEQSQRILGVVPMFGVTSRQDATQLTPGQKFRLFVKSSVDPFVFVSTGIQAGIAQANHDFPAYGRGAAGYAKRYDAALADATSSQFFSNFFFPVLLKQDPRYFRLGEGTFRHRFAYSLSRALVARTDSGKASFNWSDVLGAVSSGTIANAYYPASDRGFRPTMNGAGISLVYGSAGGLLDEFWPDIQRKVFHRQD